MPPIQTFSIIRAVVLTVFVFLFPVMRLEGNSMPLLRRISFTRRMRINGVVEEKYMHTKSQLPDPWDLDQPLAQWSKNQFYTLRHALASVSIFGETGASKSTASLPFFLLPLLLLGLGGVFNCVKADHLELLRFFLRITGREDSLIVVSPNSGFRCNMLRYIYRRPGVIGSKVEQLLTFLMLIVEMGERNDKASGGGDKFWVRALRQLLRNAIEICIAANDDITMSMLNQVITSAPRTVTELHDPQWQAKSECYRLIAKADSKSLPDRHRKDFELAARYFMSEIPQMPAETLGSILATYGAMADTLLRGQMADTFDTDTNFIPEMTYEGAIIAPDMSLKVYGPAGLQMQAALNHAFQTAVESRDLAVHPAPVWHAIDEAQELINENTPRFLATARSQRCASILATQNISSYYAAFGGQTGKDFADQLIGNTGTVVLHANGHAQTNKWASDMISDEVQMRRNYQANPEKPGGQGGGGETVGHKVLPSEFTMMRKGGPRNGFLSDAIVYQTGESFEANEGQPYLRTSFTQVIPGREPGSTGRR